MLAMVFHAIKLEDRRSIWYSGERIEFYASDFYKRGFNVAKVHKTLKEKIPSGKPVSAHTQLAPHLPNRETLLLFPTIKNAEYIALLNVFKTYPMVKEDYQEKIYELKSTPDWELIHNENKLLIFKKKGIF